MIKIANRFRPFSHTPGSACVLPYSNWVIKAYPTKISLEREGEIKEIFLKVKGPVKDFTLLQDLEGGEVAIFGKGQEGYFHFVFKQEENGLFCTLFRGESCEILFEGKELKLKKKEKILVVNEKGLITTDMSERLSFGSHKKLDWDLVVRRMNLAEILPVIFFLGQKVKEKEPQFDRTIKTRDEFLCAVQAAFSSLLVPKRSDTNFLGLSWEEIPSSIPVINLLPCLYTNIKKLLIQENGSEISLLHNLFPEFHAGRLINGKLSFGLIDIEWAKRKIKKVNIIGKEEASITFLLPKSISTFRLKHHPKEKGEIVSVTSPIKIIKHQRYFLDKFEG